MKRKKNLDGKTSDRGRIHGRDPPNQRRRHARGQGPGQQEAAWRRHRRQERPTEADRREEHGAFPTGDVVPNGDVRSDVSPGTKSGPVTNTNTILQVATLADDGTGADLGTHAKRDLPANLHTIVKPPGGCARRHPRGGGVPTFAEAVEKVIELHQPT